jgi:transcriptional regulator with XRE-family HTH domain
VQESNKKAPDGGAADVLGSRLRSTREAYGISLRELARRVGVSASLISQIETGKVHPSVTTLYALASELDASVDELLFEDAATRGGNSGGDSWGFLTGHPHMEPVQRTTDRQVIELQSGVRWERLTSGSVPGIDFLHIIYEPGGESAPEDAMQQHAGREWGYIIEGTLHVTIGFEDHVIGPGDAIAFDSTTPHRLYNEGPEEVRAIWYVLGWQSGRPAPSS